MNKGNSNIGLIFSCLILAGFLVFTSFQAIAQVLDALPGAHAAYSIRLLKSTYNTPSPAYPTVSGSSYVPTPVIGPGIRVRRSSDDALQDIGFLPGGNLDNVSLLNFIGGKNLLTYSEDLTNPVWSLVGGTIASNTAVAPNGTNTADVFTESVANSEHFIDYNLQSPSSNSAYSFSVYAKAVNNSNRYFILRGVFANSAHSAFITFDLVGGTIVQNTGGLWSNPGIAAVGGGWFRLSGTYTTPASIPAATDLIFRMQHLEISPPANVYAGVTSASTSLWGAQLQPGTIMLAYTPTTASPQLTIPNGFIHTWFDQTGNSRHLVQVNQANQPMLVQEGVILVTSTGRPTVKFNGAGTYTSSSFLINSTSNMNLPNSSVNMVARWNGISGAGNEDKPFGIGTENDTRKGRYFYRSGTTELNWSGMNNNVTGTAITLDSTGNHRIYCAFQNASSLTLSKDGNESTFTIPSAPSSPCMGIGMGQSYNPSQVGDIFTNISISEGMIFGSSLTPNERRILNCDQADYYNAAVALPGVSFYISGVVNQSGCRMAKEQVIWNPVTISNVNLVTNNLSKLSTIGWNAGAGSFSTVSNNGYFEFIASETDKSRLVGLSNSFTGLNQNSIQFGVWLQSNATIGIYESGIFRGDFGTYSTNDIFRIAVEANTVKYYRNGTLFYSSPVIPVTPLIVHATLYNTGATVTDANVYNYNNGDFVATPVNAGTGLIYQWKVNGINAGTNSPNYSNPALGLGAIVTCTLSFVDCPSGSLSSNTVTSVAITPNPSLGLYISSNPTPAGCKIAKEQAVWKFTSLSDNDKIQKSGNTVTKLSGTGWDAGAATYNSVSLGGYFEFTVAQPFKQIAAGLSSTYAGPSYTGIQYGIYLTSAGGLQIYESGTNRGSFGNYTINDVFRVASETGGIKYYKNGILIYTSAVSPTLPLIAEAALYDIGASVSNAFIYNSITGGFTATAINSNSPVSYNWKLNGITVQSGASNSYTNIGVVATDIISCELQLGGCLSGNIVSNTITIQNSAPNPGIAYWLQAVVDPSGCMIAGEDVVWRYLSLENSELVQASGNNLSKLLLAGWNASAMSYNSVSNNGHMEFIAAETNKGRVCGLASAYTGNGLWNAEYGLYLKNNGTFEIHELGVNYGSFGPYVTGDIFTIAVENNVVQYYLNGSLIRTGPPVATLPLQVYATLNEIGTTIKKVRVYNYTNGSFQANGVNAGASQNFQWKRNGINVGTNNSIYTNAALSPSDIITCNMSLTGCLNNTYSSDSIIIKVPAPTTSTAFYVQVVPNDAGCILAGEEVMWRYTTPDNFIRIQTSSNNIQKIVINGWNAGAISHNQVVNNSYFEFIATETNKSRLAGLSNSYTGTTLTDVKFGIYLQSTGVFNVYESGFNRGTFGTYTTNDIFRVSVEAGVLKYYKNGTWFYSSAITPVLPLFASAVLNEIGATITDAVIYKTTVGNFSAIPINAGTSLNYQWSLNGSGTGANSNAYNNTSLVSGNNIHCQLTAGSCLGTSLSSNNIRIRPYLPNASVAFYIEGVVNQSGCTIAGEEVVWKFTTFSDESKELKSGNNLTKINTNGWDQGAASYNTVGNNGYLEFVAQETNKNRVIGLSNVYQVSGFTSIQYGFFLKSNGTISIYESGNNMGPFGSYATNDVFKISVEYAIVKYYINGTLLYTSLSTPSLPMFAHVALNEIGATAKQVKVHNYNAGTFAAVALQAGLNPTYTWKLNGVTVQSGLSNQYTNGTLQQTDLITCVLTLGGCLSAYTYSSNTIDIKNAPQLIMDFFIRGVPTGSGCATVTEQIKWKFADLSVSVSIVGMNSLVKNSLNGAWNGGAGSWNSVQNNGSFEFTATENNKLRAVGLSYLNPNADVTSIQYAFYLQNDGNFRIYESGIDRGLFGPYAPGTLFAIKVESGYVRYYKSGILVYASAITPVLPLIVDVSINEVGGTVTNAMVTNVNAGTFEANVIFAGTYIWQVNGITMQSGPLNTYTNNNLNNNDVITCTLISAFSGCIPQTLATNSITFTFTQPLGTDFFIKGNATPNSCMIGKEQVKWELNSLTPASLAITGYNNLVKLQGGGAWNSGAASMNTVNNFGYFEFTAIENNKARAAGLSNSNIDAQLNSIQFCFNLLANGTFSIFESGINQGNFGTYAPGTVFRISVENNLVKYYKNGSVVYVSLISPVLPLKADVSLFDIGATILTPFVSNYSNGSFTAVPVNGGPSPSFNWKLNGVSVQNGPSATYNNITLVTGDVLNCIITVTQPGCSPFPIASDTIIIETSEPAGFDIAITGIQSSLTCTRIIEPVKWKRSDLSSDMVVVGANSLTRLQGQGWNCGAASWNKVYNEGFFEFTIIETNLDRVAGLSTSNTGDDLNSIQFAFRLRNNGNYEIRQSGTLISVSPSTYAAGDVFRINVISNVVKYFKNGTLIYTSLITPVLPLIADASCYDQGATISNAIINNLSDGTFNASVVNAGATPTYIWKVNGLVVQNSASPVYSNSGLNNSDQVSCEVIPSQTGCASSEGFSNIITNEIAQQPESDFYITATAATSACALAKEQVTWKDVDVTENMSVVGINSLIKISDNLMWNGGAASWNKVFNNGYLEFTASETNKSRMVGLSQSNVNANLNAIRFGVLLENNGQYSIFESGINRSISGPYSTGDIFKIAVENNVVKYYRNNVLIYTSIVVPTLPLLVDVSIYEIGGTVTNAFITNYHTGTFTASATNAGVNPNYRWLVNGAQVQNGLNASYTNSTLTPGDIVTCELTQNLAGCVSITPLLSNTIVHSAADPGLSDFYISGTPVSTSCNMIIEEVQWKKSDLVNTTATTNDLVKNQADGVWNGGAASWNSVSLNGYFQFTVNENNLAKVAGLSVANANSSNISIGYAFNMLATGELRVMESGIDRGVSFLYAPGDQLRLSVQNIAGVNRVRYYKNNLLLYTSTLNASVLPLLADVSIYNLGATISDALISNPNNGGFTAGSINAGVPNYRWKINGVTVQNGALNTYSNPGLNHNDIVTCEMTPGLNGCGVITWNSNTTVLKGTIVTVTNPPSVCSPQTIDLTLPSITAGTAPDLQLSYWSDAAATIPLSSPTQVTSGTYFIKGTRQGICSDITPVNASVAPAPSISITSTPALNQLTCTNASISLNVSAGGSFQWDNGTSATTRVINAPGTYAVTVTGANSCTSLGTYTVFQNSSPPELLINGNTSPICQGATVTLQAMPSVFNNAIRFDGVAQSAYLGNWFNYQNFTVEMWLKAGNIQSPDATIIDNNFAAGGRSWTCKQNGSSTNQYQFTCYNTLGVAATATFNLTAGLWQHVSLVKTSTALIVYVDGNPAVNVPWTLGAINYDNTERLSLARWEGGTRFWNGWMDEVRIFNKDITPARILSDMSSYFPAVTDNLVACFKMDEPDNSLLIDNTTNYIVANGSVTGNPNFLPSSIPLSSSYSYLWMPGSINTSSISMIPTAPSTHTVTTTGSNGCTATQSTSLTVSLSGLATIASVVPGCENTVPATITFTASGAVAPYTFYYTVNGVPATATTTSLSSSVTVTQPMNQVGTFVYSLQNLTYQNASFCLQAQSGSDTVLINPEPLITSVTPGQSCGPGTVSLSAATTGNTVSWYTAPTGGTSLATSTTFTTPTINATTTYYAEAVSSLGCVSSIRTAVIASVENPGQWLGYTSDWDTPLNWACNVVPSSTTDVTIPTLPVGGNFPVVSSTGVSQCRDIEIENGASVTVSIARSLSIYGDINNSGIPNWGPGELRISGNVMQLFTAASPQIMGRLLMNNSMTGSALLLSIDVYINQQLTFSDGVIDLNGNLLSLGTAGTNGSFTGQGINSYINSHNGFTRMFTNINGAYNFPVGDSLYYTPYTLNLNSGSQNGSTVQVKVIPGRQPNLPLAIDYLNRYWVVEPVGISSTINYDATYLYAGAWEIVGGGGPMFPVKFSLSAPVPGWAGAPGSSAFVVAGTSGIHNPGALTFQWLGLTSFSDFTGAGNNGPLPVSLLSFDVHQLKNTVSVDWMTATEINNDYFEVERGRNISDMTSIARIEGAGNSTSTLQYNYIDLHPMEGLSFYRLRQTDFDGTTKVTEPKAVRFYNQNGNGPVSLYYNTNSNSLVSIWQNDEGNASLKIFDAAGREVFFMDETLVPRNWQSNITLPTLSSGIYLVHFIVNGNQYQKKLLIHP